MTRIFINYRRDDASGVAGRLFDRLSRNFSQSDMFMDVDAMKPGLDFVKQLDEQVSKCDVVLAIIGPAWLTAVDEKGRRKLDLPRDSVRIELSSALKREIPVIPLLVNGTAMPPEDDLPDDLKPLANRHGLELRHTRFAADCDAVIRALHDILPNWKRRRRTIAAVAGIAALCLLSGTFFLHVIDGQRGGQQIGTIETAASKAATNSPAQVRSEKPAPSVAPAPQPTATSIATVTPVPIPRTTPNGQPNPANVDARIALVVGNSKYPDADAPLKTPINDARLLASQLKSAGFEVTLGENLTGAGMRQKFDEFYGRIKAHSVALLFFSGYGVQSSHQTYLIPVDAQIWTEADIRRDGFKLDAILEEINSRGADIKIALLDASRRNPFERRFRNSSAGLAPVDAPIRTLVMYSGATGSVQDDSSSENSLFVTELLKNVGVPNLTAEEALNRARVAITTATHYGQAPWVSSSMAENFSLNPGSDAPR
jgi:hypothetical protein